MAVECDDAHAGTEVKLQALQATVSEAPGGKQIFFQPTFFFNNALLHIHAVQIGSCPAEPEVFTAKPQSEWRLTLVCRSRALWM